MTRNFINVDPQVQGGVPVFTGTRVPVKNLFDYLEAGESLDQFLDEFPSVRRETAIAVLEQARKAVTPNAHSS
jgi:uncharacterized protein (DUF433 family)